MEINVLRLGMIGTNCYIFRKGEGKGCGIVDPGADGDKVAAWLKERGLEPEVVLLTHGHFDHIMGIPGLRESWPDLPVYCHPADLGEGERTRTFGASVPTVASYGDIRTYREGDALTVAGVDVKVLETPGHTPGSVTLEAGDVLFTGDTLFAGSCGRTDLRGGSYEQIMASLKRLGQIEGNFHVCPGHDMNSTLAQEKKYNPFLREAMRD